MIVVNVLLGWVGTKFVVFVCHCAISLSWLELLTKLSWRSMIDPDIVLLLVLTIGIWRGTITVQLHSVLFGWLMKSWKASVQVWKDRH